MAASGLACVPSVTPGWTLVPLSFYTVEAMDGTSGPTEQMVAVTDRGFSVFQMCGEGTSTFGVGHEVSYTVSENWQDSRGIEVKPSYTSPMTTWGQLGASVGFRADWLHGSSHSESEKRTLTAGLSLTGPCKATQPILVKDTLEVTTINYGHLDGYFTETRLVNYYPFVVFASRMMPSCQSFSVTAKGNGIKQIHWDTEYVDGNVVCDCVCRP